VYGLSNAGTDQRGISHWIDSKVLASLTASAVLLVTFVLIERRSRHPLMPLRIFADRSRSGAFLIMLLVATALFGTFLLPDHLPAGRARLQRAEGPAWRLCRSPGPSRWCRGSSTSWSPGRAPGR
jgi:hypothetical protein